MGGKRPFQRQFQTILGLPNAQYAEIKSSGKYSWTFYAHSNQFIPLNVQEKAQKADGIKKLTKKKEIFSAAIFNHFKAQNDFFATQKILK